MNIDNDTIYMQRCIYLARLGMGNVAPNPMVGAVLVNDNRIIGEGYHRQYGHAHAEVNCIHDAEMKCESSNSGVNNIESLLQTSTLYVSLEPCAHFGKTPPCADLIIKKKIPKVVIGCRDPFEQVNGKGIEKLQAAGVEVVTGVLEEACKTLNKRFFTFHIRHRPYIILKWAQSENRKISGPAGSKVCISNSVTNRSVHKWRSEEAAILVGTTTALLDNPSLTTRLWTGNHPVRLVVDMNLRLPASLAIFNGASRTIIFNKTRHEQHQDVFYYRIDENFPFLEQLTGALYQLNITSMLVEGGAKLLQAFIDAQLWDEARVITNNELHIAAGTDAPDLSGGELMADSEVYTDTIRIFRPVFV